MKLTVIAFFSILSISLLACQSNSIDSEPATPIVKTPTNDNICKEPRPEMCTQEYKPVCATRDTGVRCVTTPCPSSEQVTKSNACMACADEKVISYHVDACADSD